MDIADITKMAKQFLMEDGSHAPTLFIQTDKQIIIAEVRDLPGTPTERLLALQAAGQQLGQARRGEVLREVGFIVLGWASMHAVDDPTPRGRPSQDPNRKEIMIISFVRLTPDGVTNESELVEILRDGQGKVHDLYHIPNEIKQQPQADPLVMAFIDGFRRGDMPPIDPATGTDLTDIPPHQK